MATPTPIFPLPPAYTQILPTSLPHPASHMETDNLSSQVPAGVSRSPVTELEREALLKLNSKLLSKDKSVFYCTGRLGELGAQIPRIHFVTGGGESEPDRANVIRVSVENAGGYADLHDACKPSHFGVGDKAVMDESYRTARDLPSEHFAINFDPLHRDHGVLDRISAATLNVVKATRYKLNSYVTGGFFKRHKDTPKSENHTGTLLFGMPSPFTGGELLLRHGDRTVTIDWSKELGVSWVFFYSDIEHEILPVTSGHRVTIAYDIYSIPESPEMATDLTQLGVDVTALPLYRTFECDILKNVEFRPQGCRLAFPLRYSYPLADKGWTNKFSSTLKGEDAILLKTLEHFNLQTRLVAVYQVDWYDEDEYDSDSGIPVPRRKAGSIDEFTPRCGNSSAFLTADSFEGIQGEYIDQSDADELKEQLGAELEADVIWCRRPDSFVLASTYITYGNEPSTGMSYVAAAIIISVPAVGDGVRVV